MQTLSQTWPFGALTHDQNQMDCFTADLPLPVRVSMARAWMTAVALELGLSNQPEGGATRSLARACGLHHGGHGRLRA